VELLQPEDAGALRLRLAQALEKPVTITLFTAADTGVTCVSLDGYPLLVNDANRPYLPIAHQLATEIATLSPLIHVREVGFSVVDDLVARFHVTHVPTFVTAGAEDVPPLVFLGTPLGHEFMTFVEGIVDESKGRTRLSLGTLAELQTVDRPASLKVFVTPSCPHCVKAGRLAQQFGMANALIRVEVIEAGEFPEVADQYFVSSVPKSIMNEDAEVVGALSEADYLREFMTSVRSSA